MQTLNHVEKAIKNLTVQTAKTTTTLMYFIEDRTVARVVLKSLTENSNCSKILQCSTANFDSVKDFSPREKYLNMEGIEPTS